MYVCPSDFFIFDFLDFVILVIYHLNPSRKKHKYGYSSTHKKNNWIKSKKLRILIFLKGTYGQYKITQYE